MKEENQKVRDAWEIVEKAFGDTLALEPQEAAERWNKMMAVVEAVKKIGMHLARPHRTSCTCSYCQIYDAIVAYDQAGGIKKVKP